MDWTQMLNEAERTGNARLRARAERARDREYAACQAKEDAFMFYWSGRKRSTSLAEANTWMRRILDGLNVTSYTMVLNPGQFVWSLLPHWEAYYVPDTRLIMVKSERVKLDTLLHELAHHVCAVANVADNGHGKAFLKAEERIFNFLEAEGPKVLR